jgi:predicted MFS family arabinose efflux permease
MYSFPFCCGETGQASLLPLAATLGLWSMGSSMLSTAPLAYVSDRVDESKRAQAIALLRTSGDVGFLIGAAGTGALADWAGSLDMAMQASAGLLLTATAWFTLRQALTLRIAEATGSASADSNDPPHSKS